MTTVIICPLEAELMNSEPVCVTSVEPESLSDLLRLCRWEMSSNKQTYLCLAECDVWLRQARF